MLYRATPHEEGNQFRIGEGVCSEVQFRTWAVYLRREFSYSNYEQNYTLPEDVDKEGIAAKVENGILTVTLPKAKKEEKKEEKKAASK